MSTRPATARVIRKRGPVNPPLVLTVGVLGHAGVARAHLNALKKLPYMFPDPPVRFELAGIAGQSPVRVEAAARRYGFAYATTDWRRVSEDRRINLFINCAPNDTHAEPCLNAAAHGAHLLCEKPMARNAVEARRMWDGVRRRPIRHQVGFNYRFVPAVRLAREMLNAGEFGDIVHFRCRYTDDSLSDPASPHTWRHEKQRAGMGAVGDLASHVLDMARFLIGPLRRVAGLARTVTSRRPTSGGGGRLKTVEVEDAYAGAIEFDNGAVGTLEVSTLCPGQKNFFTFEVNGTKGTLRFNLERLNELEVYRPLPPRRRDRGFMTVMIGEADHPYGGVWWPVGHIIGWEHTFVHQLHHLVSSIAGRTEVPPLAADFREGLENARLCDALIDAAAREKWMVV